MNVDLITRLIKAGTPPELVAEVAAEFAKAAADVARASATNDHEPTPGALRTRRWRDRHNASQNVTRDADVTENVTCDAAPLSLSPNENNSNPHTHTPEIKPRARKDGFELPSHIPQPEWAAYVEMRVRIRKPMTDHAKRLAVRELDKLAADGWPPGDVLNHSTMNSYQGLFPPKDQRNGRTRNFADDRSGSNLLERLRADDAAAGLA